jgi:hypothetical protein
MTSSTLANHYVIAGDGISGTIDTSSFSGQPVVGVEVDGQALEDVKLREIALGIQVTGLVRAIPDLETVRATILVPRANVDESPVVFAGVALLTTIRTSIGGPRLVDGPLELYSVRPIGGSAETVQF